MKQLIKSLLREVGLQSYRIVSPKHFPAGWDVASDIKRSSGSANSTRIIFDVGANIGQTASYFHRRFSLAKIYSFEPVNNTYLQLKENVKHISNIQCFNLALGSSSQQQEIVINPKSSGLNSMSASVKANASGELRTEIVKVTTLDEFFRQNGIESIDVLKIDTEGYELEVLKGAEEVLSQNKVKYIFSEVGFDPNDQQHTLFSKLSDHLQTKNFRFYGFYDSCYWHDLDRGMMYSNSLFVNSKAF